ncbi:MAG TPA: DUF1064 domain-containing protein [Rubrivivax sp.]|nr:DUF1064 domain-containing protein [Rubrivivax sp.]HRY86534.1 DUF1064 domain-containing protein [Rubrivivax sp.]
MPRGNKYGAKKVVVDGVAFDSKREAKRWGQLLKLHAEGAISLPERQVRYELIPKQARAGVTERACHYVADFRYVRVDGVMMVEDVKSPPTRKKPDYVIKRKLMLQKFGIAVREVML